MNYSRGVQPSCCSKGEYEAENRKRWHEVKTTHPLEGAPVLVLNKNGTEDPDFWETDIAYYCDGEFFYLEYDYTLGIMRKEHYPAEVEYWANFIIPDPNELKE